MSFDICRIRNLLAAARTGRGCAWSGWVLPTPEQLAKIRSRPPKHPLSLNQPHCLTSTNPSKLGTLLAARSMCRR